MMPNSTIFRNTNFYLILTAILTLPLVSCRKTDHKETGISEKIKLMEMTMFQQPDSVETFLAEVETINLNSLEETRIKTIKGFNYKKNQNYEKCIQILKEAERDLVKYSNKDFLFINKLVQAFAFEHLLLKDKAVGLYTKCESYFDNNECPELKFYASLGILRLSESMNMDKNKLFNKLYNEAKAMDNRQFRALLNASMGNLEKNDSVSIILFKQAVDDFKECKRYSNAYTLELNILFTEIKQNPFEKMYNYYFNFPKMTEYYTPNTHQSIRYEYALAYLYAKNGKSAKAIEHATKTMGKAKEAGYRRIERDCSQLLSVLYQRTKQFQKSIAMLKKHNQLVKQYNNDQQQQQLLALGAFYKFTEFENQNSQLALQVQRAWIRFIGICVLFLFIVLYASFRWKKSMFRQKILQLENMAIEEQIGKLIGSLRDEKKKNFLLIEQVEKLRSEYNENEKCTAILDAIENKNITSWVDFEVYFTKLFPHWIENLKQKAPQLTATDMRYCMCLYFNLNNYQISALCNISGDAIKSAKKRIRDKLKLKNSKDLYPYLKSISSTSYDHLIA